MTHQVVWMPRAARALAVIWNAAYDRELISHAIDSIHTELAEDAHDKGESRDGVLSDLFRVSVGCSVLVQRSGDRSFDSECLDHPLIQGA